MTTFPAALDYLSSPGPLTPVDSTDELGHSRQHGLANSAIMALEVKVGTTNSTDPASLDNRVTVESQARVSGDAALSAAITAEAMTRASADSTLTTNVAANAANITANASAITAEVTARTNADNVLTANVVTNAATIAAETTARASADSTLSANVSTNTANIVTNTANIATNAANIAAETTARTAADSALTTNVAAKYTKPGSGIPSADLDVAVSGALVPTGGSAGQYLGPTGWSTPPGGGGGIAYDTDGVPYITI